MTSRNYCFTAFSFEEVIIMKNFEKTKYICWGHETCPTTGKTHFQGYIELSESLRIAAFKKLGVTSTHFEKRFGTQEQAITYCKKDGNFVEIGIPGKQGQRADLTDLKENLDKKMSIKEISEINFACFMKYNRSIKEYKQIHSIERN